jgi:hypothetical protein
MSKSVTDQTFVIKAADLRDPVRAGDYVRAFCHLHGSDHQRSLSIKKENGFGQCFACGAKVLVAEWNSTAAQRFQREMYLPSTPRIRCVQRPIDLLKPIEAKPSIPIQADALKRNTLALLRELEPYMQRALLRPRALAYLAERAIPLEVAQASELSYIPHDARLSGKYASLASHWRDRIIFPLASPQGKGFIGRSLYSWEPGITEEQHKEMFEEMARQLGDSAPKRYYKTTPAGCFGYDPGRFASCIVMVEGAFDALALFAVGFSRGEVVALVGTPAHVDWIPDQVQSVVLALDADEKGRATAHKLAEELKFAGVAAIKCLPPSDGLGKDWSERWRRSGIEGVSPIFEARASCLRQCEPSAATTWSQALSAPVPTSVVPGSVAVPPASSSARDKTNQGDGSLQEVCQTRISLVYRGVRLHPRRPIMFRDAFGNGWCRDCYHQSELITLGMQIDFPELIYNSSGARIDAGYEAWFEFAQDAGFVAVEQAERQARLRVQERTSA